MTEILNPIIKSSEVQRVNVGDFCPILRADYVITDPATEISYRMTCKVHPDDINLLGAQPTKLTPITLNGGCEVVEAIVHFENITECQQHS